MTDRIPEGIEATHILQAIKWIAAGVPNKFAESTGYDVLFEGKRFAPKAVVGVAAGVLTGEELGPYDFKGGIGSKCFKVLINNGFVVVTKGDTDPYPDEIDGEHHEGRSLEVRVNRFERDPEARKKCIKHYGASCQVCGLDFKDSYGAIGDGFIHVHHLVPLASIGKEYVVKPVEDLRPVCPNCHAMLHKRIPPLSIEELRSMMNNES
jgi:hypothetical protein